MKYNNSDQTRVGMSQLYSEYTGELSYCKNGQENTEL